MMKRSWHGLRERVGLFFRKMASSRGRGSALDRTSYTGTIMTSDEFHELAEECSFDFDGAQRDAPLTESLGST
jgi:hypothetical protein